jgi:hypothetical protein
MVEVGAQRFQPLPDSSAAQVRPAGEHNPRWLTGRMGIDNGDCARHLLPFVAA